MIRIPRPACPKALKLKEKILLKELKAAYNLDSISYHNGTTKFKFDSKVYSSPAIKKLFKTAQNRKCCYCEFRVSTTRTYGAAEHYRPKAGYQQDDTQELQTPGYYWLAYKWDNLLLACGRCNSLYKKNFFPLANPTQRATNHLSSINGERPLLINPYKESPERYIAFRGVVPYAKQGNVKGVNTISRLGLDQPDEERSEYYEKIKLCYRVFHNPQIASHSEEKLIATNLLNLAKNHTAPFSLMIKYAIKDGFKY